MPERYMAQVRRSLRLLQNLEMANLLGQLEQEMSRVTADNR